MHHRIPLVLALLVLSVPPLASQTPATQPWGIVNVRFDTRTSNFIYAGYGIGPVFGFVGVLNNQRSGYNEVLGGGGFTFSAGSRYDQLTGFAASRASDAWYAQVYYLPTLRAGPATLRATAQLNIPAEDKGTPQFAVSPLSITVPVVSRVALGPAMELAAERGARTSVELGPEVRLALPSATLGVNGFRHLDKNQSRLRVFFSAAF